MQPQQANNEAAPEQEEKGHLWAWGHVPPLPLPEQPQATRRAKARAMAAAAGRITVGAVLTVSLLMNIVLLAGFAATILGGDLQPCQVEQVTNSLEAPNP